jgi:hypothetical protein
MKYPPAPLTPFLASLLCIRRRIAHPERARAEGSRSTNSQHLNILHALELSCRSFYNSSRLFSIVCSLFFPKHRGGGTSAPRRVLCARPPQWVTLSFAVVASVLVFNNLQIAPSTPSVCIPHIFIHLQIAFFATHVFSQTSALPPVFSQSIQIAGVPKYSGRNKSKFLMQHPGSHEKTLGGLSIWVWLVRRVSGDGPRARRAVTFGARGGPSSYIK